MTAGELILSNLVYGKVYYYLSLNMCGIPTILEYHYKSCLKENGEILGNWFDHNPTNNHNHSKYVLVTEYIGEGMFVLYDTIEEAEQCRKELVKDILNEQTKIIDKASNYIQQLYFSL